MCAQISDCYTAILTLILLFELEKNCYPSSDWTDMEVPDLTLRRLMYITMQLNVFIDQRQVHIATKKVTDVLSQRFH